MGGRALAQLATSSRVLLRPVGRAELVQVAGGTAQRLEIATNCPSTEPADKGLRLTPAASANGTRFAMKLSCQTEFELPPTVERRPTMLVLTRRCQEKVVLPTIGVEVEVLRIEGKRVQLGITAPEKVTIYRNEVADRLAREQPAMNSEIELRDYEEALRAEVCSHCVERRPNCPPCGPFGKTCGIERHVAELVDICRQTESKCIHPYIEKLHEEVCKQCEFKDSPSCPCPLDYLMLLAVEAVERVESRQAIA
jgi:carbon storage regulator CsrA